MSPSDDVAALDAALARAGLGQKEFAELGGWTPGHVNRWLRQRRSDPRRLPDIALALAAACAELAPEGREEVRAEMARRGVGAENRAAFAFAFAYAMLDAHRRRSLWRRVGKVWGTAHAV